MSIPVIPPDANTYVTRLSPALLRSLSVLAKLLPKSASVISSVVEHPEDLLISALMEATDRAIRELQGSDAVIADTFARAVRRAQKARP